MAIDPSISLAVRPPLIQPMNIQSPVDRLAQVLSLRNLMTQGQSGQIGLQTQQLQLDQMRRDMQEREDLAKYLQQHFQGAGQAPDQAAPGPVQQTAQVAPAAPQSVPGMPNVGAAPSPPPGAPLGALMAPAAAPAAIAPAAQGGMPSLNYGDILTRFPNIGPATVKSMIGMQQADAEAQIKQHDANAKVAERLGSIGISIRDAQDPAAAFTSGVMQAVSESLLPPAVGRQMIADGYEKHKNDVQAFIDRSQNVKDRSETAKNNLVADQDAQKNAAVTVRGVKDQAGYEKWIAQQPRSIQAMLGGTFSPTLKDVVQNWGVPGADLAKTQMAQRAADAQTLAPARARGDAAYQAALAALPPDRAGIFADAKTPAEVMQRALTPQETQQASEAATTATETARQHKQQNAFEAARLAIEKTRSSREENIYQQTYGPNANQSLVGVDPKLRTQVTREAQKIGDEFAKAQSSADQFQAVLDLAKAGNKAAGSNLPLIGVETLNAINGIKRINKDEIKQYGSAGSLYDKITGEISGLAVGQPIPADVLKDIETMHNTLRQGAEAEFRARRKSLNDVYKSNFPTEVTRSGAAKTPPAVGTVEDGYRFKGGDASKAENWEKQ